MVKTTSKAIGVAIFRGDMSGPESGNYAIRVVRGI